MIAGVSDRHALEAEQFEKLRALIRAIVPANSFYAKRIATAGIDMELSSLDGFVTKMPFTLKSELIEDQRAHPPFGTNLTFPLARYTRIHATSGTSGEPLRWLDTPES